MTRHVIVGGGIAGLCAALEIRRRDDSADIVLVQDETHPTIFRAGLGPWMEGAIDDAELLFTALQPINPAFSSRPRSTIRRRITN